MDPYGQRPRALVLDCGGIGTIDSSGIDLVGNLRSILAASFQQLRERRINHWRNQLRRVKEGKMALPMPGTPKYLYASERSIKQALDTCLSDPFHPPPIVFTTVRGKVHDRLFAAARYATVSSAYTIGCQHLWFIVAPLQSKLRKRVELGGKRRCRRLPCCSGGAEPEGDVEEEASPALSITLMPHATIDQNRSVGAMGTAASNFIVFPHRLFRLIVHHSCRI